MWKGFKEFSTYNKKQRNGLLTLLAASLLLQAGLYFNDFFFLPEPKDFSDFEKYVEEWERKDSLARLAANLVSEPFPFDPNNAPDSVFRALGFSPKLRSTIINYRSKGGRFRKPEDLGKIYGMDSSLYNKVLPYVSIASAEKPVTKKEGAFQFKKFDLNQVAQAELVEMGLYEWQARMVVNYRKKVRLFRAAEELYRVYNLDSFIVEKMLAHAFVDTSALASVAEEEEEKKVIVEINSADSLQLLELSGVGPYYAKMIKRYRDRLGGFHHEEQLLEVYGMDTSRLAQFREQLEIDARLVRKLDINEAEFRELLQHPYLEFNMVKSIVNFREQVRPFRDINELTHLEFMTDSIVEKLTPYLELGQ